MQLLPQFFVSLLNLLCKLFHLYTHLNRLKVMWGTRLLCDWLYLMGRIENDLVAMLLARSVSLILSSMPFLQLRCHSYNWRRQQLGRVVV